APPPAAAGQVLTSADAPVDFGDQAFVVGTASAYAGGVTKALGTGTTAGGRGATTPSAPPAPPKKSRSQSVRLEGSAWRCPWPSKALDADIYEQSVVLKVRVGSDGRARSVEVLEDPGLGFGDAARACAMKTRFTPALDREGDPVTATSPPIRVRFTR
ncbi:MAG: energy transducer TonB, partial [Nannocystaceae bacterium]